MRSRCGGVAMSLADAIADDIRSRCRDPKCKSALPVKADWRRAFCSRSCFERFHRTRCRVCGEDSPNGRLHARSCSNAHRQNPTLYAYRRLEKPGMGIDARVALRASRNPIKQGIQPRQKSWGPTLSDDEFWLASLPMHQTDIANGRRANDPVRIRAETAWGRPKVEFGPDSHPLNLVGGYRFPGTFTPTVGS